MDRERTTIQPGPKENVLQSATILVAEDEPVNRELFKRWFERQGAVVTTFATAEELADYVRDHGSPSLIFSDNNLGSGMKGVDLIRRLKDQPETRNTPMVLMSGDFSIGKSPQQLQDDQLRYGFDAAINKPFDFPRATDLARRLIAESASSSK